MATLAESGLNWCYCDSVPSGGQLPVGNILRPLLMKNFIRAGSVVIRSEVFRSAGGFGESDAMRGSEAWDLWLRVAAENPIALVAEPLIQLADQRVDRDVSRGRKAVVEAAVSRNELALKELRSEALAEICIAAGIAHLRANQRAEARSEFAEALTHSARRADAYLSWVASFMPSEAQQQIRDLHHLGRFTRSVDRRVTMQH